MTGILLRVPELGEPTGVWLGQIGTVYRPLRLYDGTKWRVFADAPGYELSIPKLNPGGPLMIRDASNDWVVISREGYSWGTITGRVFDFNGVPLANRTVDAFAGRQLDHSVTDANGRFQLIALPIDLNLYLNTFWFVGRDSPQETSFSYSPTLVVTDDNPHLTYDVHLPIVT